jgi:hypothetical protein
MNDREFEIINKKLDIILLSLSEKKPKPKLKPKPMTNQKQAEIAVKKLHQMRHQLHGRLTMLELCERLGVEHNNVVINALGNRLLTMRGCTRGRTKLERYYVFPTPGEVLL